MNSKVNNYKVYKKRNQNAQNFYTNIAILVILFMFLALNIINSLYYLIARYKWNAVTEFAENSVEKEENYKYILFWTTFYESKYWGMGANLHGEEYLKSVDCPVKNCIFSHMRNFLTSPADYDAIIFHTGEPFDIYDLPSIRSEHQAYIMVNQESPLYTMHDLKFDRNFFNLTQTYRLDSDILFSYSFVSDVKNGGIVAPSKTAKWRKPEFFHDPKILNLVNSKSKQAAWFVSNCEAFSNRDLLAKKLQQYIDIDIYGKCGNLSCPRENQEICTAMLNSTYKFYLAFENSICADYITEKIFLNMENYVVPIVYNGVSDMQNFLPPHSYINVNDFSSIKELANYLKFLDENPQEYANYFWWKKYYKIIINVYPHVYCNLCVKLNEWDMKQKKQQYLDIAHWYNHKTCMNKKINF